MTESIDTTAEAAWEDARCSLCGNVEHAKTCPAGEAAEPKQAAKPKQADLAPNFATASTTSGGGIEFTITNGKTEDESA